MREPLVDRETYDIVQENQLMEVASTLAASGIETERYKVTIPVDGRADESGLYSYFSQSETSFYAQFAMKVL